MMASRRPVPPEAEIKRPPASLRGPPTASLSCSRTARRGDCLPRHFGAAPARAPRAGRAIVADWLEAVDLVLLQRPILARASEPLPIPLGTLDALHLATALVWRDRIRRTLVMATHDDGLALAARSFGLQVLGA
jgi:hypothetical protein